MSAFELIATASANGAIPVSKYKSKQTGLTVILAAVEGPVVNGYFTLATEALDDDGLPHTLEHLIFLGSEQYPYKGVLDLLANRCFASGTNAWTDTDHTCYTMTTAGKDGFRELLPIYLDHILYPTLSDSGFITEVHHVSGEGEDGGVVYCEMQGRENSGESRGFLNLLRACYENSGYSSETGGILHNLRTSTTNRKVRDYHAKFYRPENLSIIIVGQISSEEVFAALQSVEDKIIQKMLTPLPPFTRPWQTPVQPLKETKRIKIKYPSDEESVGLVYFGYRGPLCSSDHLSLTACSALMHYLAHTSVSPLYKEFIEIPGAYGSNISFDLCENYESLLYFTFVNVPLDKVDQIEDKLNALLKRISTGEEDIDMKRLGTILDRNALEYVSNLESEPHDTIAYCMIGDVLYGSSPEEFDIRLNVPKELAILKDKSKEFWVSLLQKYFIDVNYVMVQSIPSIEEQQEMTKAEMERVMKQNEDLGPIGLQTKGEELVNAMMENEILAPNEMLTGVPVPTTDGINFHPRTIYRASGDDSPPGLDLKQMPVFTEAYHVHTNFIYLIVTINTKDIEPSLRPYLPLFLQLITESPVQSGDTLIPYEDVVAALESDTISVGTRLGLESNASFSCGPFSNTVSLMLQVEMNKYETGVKWIVDLLQNTVFATDRIEIVSSKMANSVAQAKRKHDTVVQNISKAMYYNADTNVQANSLLRQFAFLNNFTEKKFQEDLNQLRRSLIVAKNMAVHIAADWDKLSSMGIDLLAPWGSLLREDDAPVCENLTVIPDWKLMNSATDVQGTVVGLGGNESAFLYHTVPCINSFDDPDLPVLMLFLQYLTQLEGPLWRQIRGQGLSYGYHIMPAPNEGLLYMTLYKSSNVVAAYREMCAIIQAQLQKDTKWDNTLLESAKSSLIFELIEREKNIGDLVVQALLTSFKVVPSDYNRKLVERINTITTEDLERVGRQYVEPLFSEKAKTAIVCHPEKASDIAEAFAQLGRKLTFETCLDDCVFFK